MTVAMDRREPHSDSFESTQRAPSPGTIARDTWLAR